MEYIQELTPTCILFVSDIVLFRKSRDELDESMKTWSQYL